MTETESKDIQPKKKSNRGFAAMDDKEEQRAIARKGGLTVSQNREHMAAIGSKGGIQSGKVRAKQPVVQ